MHSLRHCARGRGNTDTQHSPTMACLHVAGQVHPDVSNAGSAACTSRLLLAEHQLCVFNRAYFRLPTEHEISAFFSSVFVECALVNDQLLPSSADTMACPNSASMNVQHSTIQECPKRTLRICAHICCLFVYSGIVIECRYHIAIACILSSVQNEKPQSSLLDTFH
jgi:hypothetical protein